MAIKNTHEDLMKKWQPQQKNLFELSVTGMGSLFNDDVSGTLLLSLASLTFPNYSTEEITVEYLNTEMYFAGKTTISNMTASFRDYCDQDTLAALKTWRRMVWNEKTHRAGLAADYKKTGTITIYPPDFGDGGTLAKRSGTCEGLWPTSFDYDGLDMSDTGQLMVSVGLRCDKFIWDED
jgi:hypothetical protein